MRHKVNFNKGEHAASILDRVEGMRRNKKHCDFKIKLGSEEIETHRNILAAGSDYFDAMLSHDTKENRSGIVEMIDVDAECVKICLDYVYRCEVEIPDEKYEKLMYVAQLMQLQKLCDRIAELIGANLGCKSFFEARRVADLFGCKILQKKCENFAEENFVMLSMEEEFGGLDKSYIKKMVRLENVKMTEEEKLDTLLRWVKFDGGRNKVLGEMMQCVKLSDVPVGYRRYLLERDHLVNDSMECFRILSFSLLDTLSIKSCPSGKNRLAIVLFDQISGYLQQFVPGENSWKQMQEINPEMKEGDFSAVSLDDHIYVLLKKRSVFRLRYCYELATWEQMADMLEMHGSFPPAIVLAGYIYVIGGNDMETSCIERYDPAVNQWSKIEDRRRTVLYSDVVEFGEDVYCVGGFDCDAGTEVLCEMNLGNVERFNAPKSEWTLLAQMNERRMNVASLGMDDNIYAVGGLKIRNGRPASSAAAEGGRDIIVDTNTVERYNISSNSWMVLEPMRKERSRFRVFAVDGFIYAVGGHNGSADIMEKYDVEKNEWEMVAMPCKMNILVLESVKIKRVS